MFGHIVQFNFNKGPTHKTFIGGFISFIIKTVMSTFLIVKIRTIFVKGDDELSSVEFVSHLDDPEYSQFNF